MDPLEQNLNPEQLRAVKTTQGPVLILAGAGSGKTKTLTHRIAWLIHHEHIPPKNILAVTFTNKASKEMKERLIHLLNQFTTTPTLPNIGTFHHICSLLLRQEIPAIGYTPTFTILDDQEQQSLVKRTTKALDINTDQFQPRAILSTISRFKNALITPEQALAQADNHYEETIARLYTAYQKTLFERNSLDFDDLIRLAIHLFRQFPEILERYQSQFRYILVDEYQDTNFAQYTLIQLLSQKHHNLFVIGDDYQSIYGWRQADITNILNFEKDYPEAAIIFLEQNYRSTQIILDAAQHIIHNNTQQRHKQLWTEQTEGDLITHITVDDEKEEAAFICHELKNLQQSGTPLSDCALLYRTNSQSRVLEETLLKNNIPYTLFGGIRFYDRKEIRDLIAYLRLIHNPRDLFSLERIINVPKRHIGSITFKKWLAIAEEKQLSPLALTPQDFEHTSLKPAKAALIQNFINLFLSLSQELTQSPSLTSFLETLLEKTAYLASLDDGTPESEVRRENVRELLSIATPLEHLDTLPALQDFLDEVALASSTEAIHSAESVHLMTLHSSKGLEFPFVFILGLEESIFPHSRSQFSLQELEEERRLMYVGLTRARRKIYLLNARQRTLFGATQVNPPSRFLKEIPLHLIHKPQLTSSSSSLTSSQKHSSFIPSSETFRPGDSLSHPEFGAGVVISLAGDIITVAFQRKGIKKLALSLAPITKIS
ncbi:MAG: UvrD-helicase domain-containing protein [Candidatus Moraniibacteriota bacterium]